MSLHLNSITNRKFFKIFLITIVIFLQLSHSKQEEQNDIDNNKQTFLNYNQGGLGDIVSDIETDDPNFKYEEIPGVYTKILNETSIVNDIKYFIFTKIDFLNEERKNKTNFDLVKNVNKFLKDNSGGDISNVTSSEKYKENVEKNFKKKTILIGIDGLVNSCIDYDKLPGFKYFIENGSYKFDLRSAVEGLSGPGWSSTLCSLDSRETGIVDNKWKAPWISEENRNSYNYSTPLNGKSMSFPCIFDELKFQSKIINPEKEFVNAFYSTWEFFNENLSNKAYPKSVDIYAECKIRTKQTYFEYLICDSFSLDRAKNIILEDTDFFFWYFSSIDVSGHTYSFCSSEYSSRVRYIDEILSYFLDYLKLLGILDKVNIVITSDHGSDRSRLSHGNDRWDGNLLVPLFMMGPDFKKNYNIKQPFSTIDIAPTIMKLNGFPSNPQWRGRVIDEAFEGTGEIEKKISQTLIKYNSTDVILESSELMKFSYYLSLVLLIFYF